jgi:hypothetical protein
MEKLLLLQLSDGAVLLAREMGGLTTVTMLTEREGEHLLRVLALLVDAHVPPPPPAWPAWASN